MMRVYLSGPMTGIADNNFPAFHDWAAKLRAEGFDVISPAEIQEAGSWEACLRADLRELCTCDGLALMPGWENSRGAHLELHVAHRLGLRVLHLPLQFDLVSHLQRQMEFSKRTFGPGPRTEGVVDHIRKELIEVLESGGALAEWVDVIILGLDGAWRTGATPTQIVEAIVAKQTRNERRSWPDWRTAEPGKAIEHVRANEAPLSQAALDVLAERRRQVDAEGWTPDHDDEHSDGSLAMVAACYAKQATSRNWLLHMPDGEDRYQGCSQPSDWPTSWDSTSWKPKDPRRDLVRAAALLLAEIERLDRAAQPRAEDRKLRAAA